MQLKASNIRPSTYRQMVWWLFVAQLLPLVLLLSTCKLMLGQPRKQSATGVGSVL